MQSTHNPTTDEIREEMAQMRYGLGLVLKHGGAEKKNAVNYLTKPPPPNNECDCEEDSYVVNEQTGGFGPSAKGSNQENCLQGQGNQGRIYGNYNCEDHYVGEGNDNRDNNFNKSIYGDRNGPYVPS